MIPMLTSLILTGALMNSYQNLPVLVTGGCGFIGSHVAQTLVGLGARVTILDNLSTGCLENIAPIKDAITLIEGNITDLNTCLQAAKGQTIIFHLAARTSVPESLQDPVGYHTTNVDGTVNMLEAARINNVQRFVFSSSASVYGNKEGICREEDPCNPLSPYALSKQLGEIYCAFYARTYALKTVCLRYFNVYGDRQNANYGSAVASFTKAMRTNSPFTIFGDGQQTRDFVPVETIAEANITLAMLDTSAMNGNIFNIATGKSISLLALVDQLKKEFPAYTQEIHFEPARAGDIRHSCALSAKYAAARSTMAMRT